MGVSVRTKRFVLLVVAGLAVFGGVRWACDGTMRDQRLIDHLVGQATWFLPDAPRPPIQRLHAWQTPRPKSSEYLYLELTRPNDLEQFLAEMTTKIKAAEATWPNRGLPGSTWSLARDVPINPPQWSDHAPRWWPKPGRADAVLDVRGTVLLAPAGSDRIFIAHFVPD